MFIAVTAVVVLYLGFGFWVAPGLVRGAILRGASERLTRAPELKRVRVNPLNLSMHVEGFSLERADGQRVLGFEDFYVRFDPLGSLIDRGLTLARLRLDRPLLAVEMRPGGALDVAELIRPDSTKVDTTVQPPPLHVKQLLITDGAISFADPSRTPPLQMGAKPVDLTLMDLRTRRGARNEFSLRAATVRGESLHWEAKFVLAPFHSEGLLELKNVKAKTLTSLAGTAIPFSMPSGDADFATRYHVDARDHPMSVGLEDLRAELRDWTLANRAADTTFIVLQRARLLGGSVDVNHSRVTLDSIAVDGGHVSLWMERNHHLNLEAWATAPDTTVPPWITHVQGIGAHGLQVSFEDRQVGPPATFELNDVEAALADLSTEPHAVGRLTSARAKIFDSGDCSASGAIGLTGPSADLQVEVKRFPLRSTQPYMNHLNRVVILGGDANGKGRLRFNTFGPKGPLLRYEGSASVDGFKSVDRKLRQELLSWRSLRLNALRYDVMPSAIETRQVDVEGGFIRVVVGPDRIPNLATVALPPDSAAGYSSFSTDSTDTLRAKIDLVNIKDGSAYFSDLSLRPAFTTGIEALNGSIKGLSSFQESGGEIALDGQVDRYAPVRVEGAFNPLSKGGHTDMSLSFKHIELTTFTPYSGKFMGYRIERGKLSLDLHYVVDGRQLQGSNKILMEQLTLGDKVDSPEATHLPVRFAIALLKDKDGNIDLDLPVKGSLDDPKFSIGRVILKVLTNLVTKAVTSPFKALGALFGGSEEQLDVIEFAAGSSVVDSSQVTRLDQLGKALTERPGLRLDIPAGYDALADSVALVTAAYEQRLRDAMQAEAARRGGPSSGGADPRSRAVEKLYVAQFGSAPPPVTHTGPKLKKGEVDTLLVAAQQARITDMEQRLKAALRLDPGDLTRLGQARALALKDQLVANGVDAGQVFVVDAGEPEHIAGPTVRLKLALDSR
ncbi:MAG TPA: DUF748 domain-containing protein [Candidatus Sulfotelmatobacter sp.]|nr:DUF748 domain-containing protein [Candidatus Sulfotelmatobacter sp.]